MKSRIKIWALLTVIALFFVQCGKSQTAKNVEPEQISANVPLAMQSSFERTLADTELDEKYEIKFTSKEANFTITTQKSDINEFIAYSPVVAVFNEDEELYQTYIEDEIFVPSDTEPEAYDFDFKKIMKDIIGNSDSSYKVYYPNSSICDWNVFYTFLLYTANDGCYPSEGTNMEQTKELVDAFLQSKNTEQIGRESLNKMKGFAKNSVYFMPLADLGYIYENDKIRCRVMYPKTVVYCNYYADFDEIGKILFDALETDQGGILGIITENIGYYNLNVYGNYFVETYGAPVSISYDKTIGRFTYNYPLEIRENFNAVEVPE